MVKNRTGIRLGRLVVIAVGQRVGGRLTWICQCDCGRKITVSSSNINKTSSCGCWRDEKTSLRRASRLIGKVFGRLTVKSRDGLDALGGILWLCQCECGKEAVVRSKLLNRGDTKSCGCLRSETTSKRMSAKLTGQKFSRLTVLHEVESSSTKLMWFCRCDCGETSIVASDGLISGHSKSCGCLSREITSAKMSIDLVGKVFGKLTVVNRISSIEASRVRWVCICSCGGTSEVQTGNLTSGATNSCGCTKSQIEVDLFDFVKSLDSSAVHNTKDIIHPFEIDVYVPGKAAIELNGLYWHGERIKGKKSKVDAFNKLSLMEEKRLPGRFIFFEDEWIYRRSAVEGYIKSRLGQKKSLGARKCQIAEGVGDEFIEKWHIQGVGAAGEVISLVHNGDTVAAAKYNKRGEKTRQLKGDWELSRYCVSPEVSVSGGLSKLQAHFWKTHTEAQRIVTFSENRLSQGKLYESTGFRNDGQVAPAYSYVKGNRRLNRFNFRKDALKKKGWLLEGETERACMLRMGYDRIWDAGKTRWVIDRPI